MSSESIYSPILKKIIDYKENLKDHMSAGGAKNMEEYNLLVGEYRCLNKIQEDILDIEKRMVDD